MCSIQDPLRPSAVDTNALPPKGTVLDIGGSHIADLIRNDLQETLLRAGGELKKAYTLALDVLGAGSKLQFKDSDIALIRGQKKIMDRISQAPGNDRG